MRRSVASVCFLITLAGCGDATAPGSPSDTLVAVQTDSLVYHLSPAPGGYTAQAMLSITNAGTQTLYFGRCMPADVAPGYDLRRSGPDSTAPTVVMPVWACVGGVPMGRMAPGTTLTVPIPLGSAESLRANPPITPEQRVGTFRASVTLCRRQDQTCPREDWVPAESAAFRLTYE